MTDWCDFNDVQQQHFDLIPKGTLARVRMTLKPGGFDDPAQGWTGGYATQSFETGSVYLAAEFVVLEGEYARRKLWSNIGLHSKKGPTWGQMGRSFIRAALNSARNVHPQDNSPQAAARIVALLLIADGHVSRSEMDALYGRDIEHELGLPPGEFGQVLHTLCEDLLMGMRDRRLLTGHIEKNEQKCISCWSYHFCFFKR